MNDLNKRLAEIAGWTEIRKGFSTTGSGLIGKPPHYDSFTSLMGVPDISNDLNELVRLAEKICNTYVNVWDGTNHKYTLFQNGERLNEDIRHENQCQALSLAIIEAAKDE